MASSASGPLLATRGLTKSFRSLVALRDHEIAVHTGEIVGVIGPNGSGKSTFFNLVSGFLRADRGEVLFGGASITRRPAAEIVHLGIARTFQGTRLFPALTVSENVRAAAELRHRTNMLDAVVGTPRRSRAEREVETMTSEFLDLVGLAHRRNERARDLPYGDQRRLWRKAKWLNRQEFVVVGWSDPTGTRPHLGALLLGGKLIYAGRVGTGMPVKVLADLRRRLEPLARKTSTLNLPPPRKTSFGSPLVLSPVHWVEPKLVAEITYLTWTADGLLPHTVYVGLREDKPANQVRREAARG